MLWELCVAAMPSPPVPIAVTICVYHMPNPATLVTRCSVAHASAFIWMDTRSQPRRLSHLHPRRGPRRPPTPRLLSPADERLQQITNFSVRPLELRPPA